MILLIQKSEALTNQKVKSLIDFDEEYSSSIRSIAIKKSSKVILSSRCLNGKILMFINFLLKLLYMTWLVFLCFQMKKLNRFIRNTKLIDVIYTKT